MSANRVVLRPSDFPLLEAPDGMMRDSIVLTDESCGSESMAAGLVWVHPHGEIHEDTHAFDEVYYVIRGSADVVMDGTRVPVSAGEIVFLRAGVRHMIDNPSDETFQIFWLIGWHLT
jgi:mannose-6-phosphate isomerase-like protein (cupin superfamily)